MGALYQKSNPGLVFERCVIWAALGLLCAIFIKILSVGMTQLDSGWDFLAYHLPFGIKIFSPAQISLYPPLEELYKGAPLFLHSIIGFIWALHPHAPVNATSMIGSIFIISYFLLAALCLGRWAILFGLLALSCPLVLIHSVSGYIDLPANLFILGILISIYQIQSHPEKSWRWIAFGLVSIFMSGASKYTTLPIAVVAGLVFAFVILRSVGSKIWLRLLLGLLSIFLSLSWCIRNVIIYNNPIYPLKVPIVGENLPYAWEMPSGVKDRPVRYEGVPQPIVTLASILEIDAPVLQAGAPRYTVDQVAGGPDSPAHRMGGFSQPFLLITSLIIIIGAIRRQLTLHEMAPLLILCGVTIFLPQSHELRYYLYMPLGLAFFSSVVVMRLQRSTERLSSLIFVIVLVAHSLSLNRVHLPESRTPINDILTLSSPDFSSVPSGSHICAKKMGFALVLLAGPTLRENTVIWTDPEEACPEGTVEVSGSGRYAY